jgi:hypothetical protein
MSDTTDDMRAEPNFEAEAYRLRDRVAELEARVIELTVDNDGLRAEMAREVEASASNLVTRGRLEIENANFKGTIDGLNARVAELQGSLDRAVVDFHEVWRKRLDYAPLWETRRFLIDSMRRCWVALGKWDDGPRDAT